MTTPIITNATKNAVLPEKVETGKPIVIQLAPEGKYPQFIDGTDENGNATQKEVVQILDDQAMQTMVANFEKAKAEAEAKGQKYGVLVDADHSSETSTNTAAMGWVTKLFIDPEKGLMAEIEPTSLGAEKINGKVYRFVSGAWTLDDDNRPQELVSIGLTNRPNLPVAPMTNAAKAKNGETSGTPPSDGEGVTKQNQVANADADTAEGAQNAVTPPADAAQNKNQGIVNMNLKEKLGLPEEATDADVEAAVDALIQRCSALEQVQNALGLEETASNEEILEAVNACLNQCGELQARNEEIEKEKVEAEADEVIAENEDVIPEDLKDEIKEEYVEDKENALATIANFRKVHDRAVLNAAKAHQEKRTPVKISNAQAKKPVELGGMEAIIASCNGDPVAINAAIKKMTKKQ